MTVPRRLAVSAGLAAVCIFASQASQAAPTPSTAAAPVGWAHPSVKAGRVLDDARINESSGLAQSSLHPRILFTHNDSGDTARFFAVGSTGQTRAVYTLRGAGSRDWEDMSAGPGHTLWFGDIGDSRTVRSSVFVYRVDEPRRLRSHNLRYVRYELRYPDGAHNAETLMVRRHTGRLFIVTKARSGAKVYVAPRHLARSSVNRLRAVATAPPTITAGDYSPLGGQFVLRGYRKAYVYDRLGGRPTVFDLPPERQGESITFNRTGTSLLAGSEGSRSRIWRIRS